jgi:hypothetical protein
MQLNAGTAYNGGLVIIGHHPNGVPMTGNGDRRLDAVVEVLQRHHNIDGELRGISESLLRDASRTSPFKSRDKGAIMRVTMGKGRLLTDEGPGDFDLEFGWWAYVSPGVKFRFCTDLTPDKTKGLVALLQ